MGLLDLIKQFGQANYNAGYYTDNYDQYGKFDEERLKILKQIVSQIEPQVIKKIEDEIDRMIIEETGNGQKAFLLPAYNALKQLKEKITASNFSL